MIRVRGQFLLKYRGPDGSWLVVARNAVTYEGGSYLLESAFRSGSRPASWHVGLISQSGYTGVSINDTHASHPGWVEYAGVLAGTRPAWSPAAANGGRVASGSVTLIQATATGVIRGCFLASVPTAGSVSPAGVLYATAAMPAARSVTAGGTLTATYTVLAEPEE